MRVTSEDIPLSVTSNDGRFVKLTINPSMSVEDFRKRIALELGIAPRLAFRMKLEHLNGQRNPPCENADSDLTLLAALSQSRSSPSLCMIRVSNCEELSSRLSFDVVRIMRHLLSDSQRGLKSTQSCLKQLRAIAGKVISLNEAQRLPAIAAPEVENTIGRCIRGPELFSKLGFQLKMSEMSAVHAGKRRHTNCRCKYVLRSNFDRNVFGIVLSLLDETSHQLQPAIRLSENNERRHALESNNVARSRTHERHQRQVSSDERIARLLHMELNQPRREIFARQSLPTSLRRRMLASEFIHAANVNGVMRPSGNEDRQRSSSQVRGIRESSQGLQLALIHQLPRQKLGAEGLACIPLEQKECGICLGEFENGDAALRLPCCHLYHEYCITQWLSTSRNCPHDMLDIETMLRGHS